MLKPLLQSVVSAVRIIDNLTDMSFIRIVMAQVCSYIALYMMMHIPS